MDYIKLSHLNRGQNDDKAPQIQATNKAKSKSSYIRAFGAKENQVSTFIFIGKYVSN